MQSPSQRKEAFDALCSFFRLHARGCMCSLVWLKEDPLCQISATTDTDRAAFRATALLSLGGVISGPHPYSQPLPGTAIQSQEKADP